MTFPGRGLRRGVQRHGGRIAVSLLAVAPFLGCGEEAGPTALPRGAAYETTLTLRTPLVNRDGIDRVVYRWSTSATSRFISMAEVADLEVELYAGTLSVFSDTVRVGGTYLPIGGVSRSGLTWDFDFGTAGLTQMNNVLWEQQNRTTGTRFAVSDNVSLPDDSIVVVRRTTDGTHSYVAWERLENQVTVVR